MPKQTIPNELAEIVTALLVKPELLGELTSVEKHQAFMLDIEKVVANHCGEKIKLLENESDAIRKQAQMLLIQNPFEMPIQLNEQSFKGEATHGTVVFNGSAVLLQIDGHTDCASDDDIGFPVYIEKNEGEIFVRVYADINQDAPTHSIPLTNTRNENRHVDSE